MSNFWIKVVTVNIQVPYYIIKIICAKSSLITIVA